MATRVEWQQLAEDRILDAQAHLAPNVCRWSGAFYLIGYAVECGLKSCVLKRVAAYPEVIFERRRFSDEAWTHDVEMLLVLADLKAARDADSALNNARRQNWLRVKDWTEISRYQQKSQAQAQRLYDAVTDSNDGVMQWIRLHW